MPMNQASSGKPHKLRLDVGDGLCQILAKSVFPALEGIHREKRHNIHGQSARSMCQKNQPRLRIRLQGS
ncbi:MAG: hypothetical protein BWY82_02571 [Verrucomicrobia bacterium ADurb.Bin474]|nr:MAG: hypothetical protein BWY82_02571 [Verrucomicrobia bacterium ADurb.Bin474]